MRRRFTVAAVLGVLTVSSGLGSRTAAAGTSKLVEGTVYDTTCAVVGECGSPCPPPCGGPIPTTGARADIVCAQVQRRIVCPPAHSDVTVAPDFCLQGLPCGVAYPLYPEEGAVVTVRRQGSDSTPAELPVIEGHFRARLSPGRYSVRIYLPNPACWVSNPPLHLDIAANLRSPVPATLEAVDACLVHPQLKP